MSQHLAPINGQTLNDHQIIRSPVTRAILARQRTRMSAAARTDCSGVKHSLQRAMMRLGYPVMPHALPTALR